MTNFLAMSLAYKAVVLQLMVGEATFFARQLDLPCPKPLEIRKSYVTRPAFGFGGTLNTTQFFFSFGKDGRLWNIVKTDATIRDAQLWHEIGNMPTVIDTNGAYRLATQWLSRIDVDLAALDRRCFAHIRQPKFFDPPIAPTFPLPTNAPMSTVPLFRIHWFDRAQTDYLIAEMEIDGLTKGLLEWRLNDTTLSKRPPLVITNAAELNGQPDPIFKKLDQRDDSDKRSLPKRP
jgi:hypothetical protein